MINRRHLLFSGSAMAAASLLGPACHSTPRPSKSIAVTPSIVPTTDPSFQSAMADQAMTFLQALDPEQQQRAVFPFNSGERLNWHYTPRPRQGLAFKDMSADQRQACDRLLQFTLSETGYNKFQNIVTLETVLQQMGGSPSIRNPELYYLTLFGDPTDTPWGWRMEGHHFSLNITVISEERMTVTPNFWGANPVVVQIEPHQGLRTLSQEQELAFALLNTLTAVQQEQVLLATQSFGDILTGPRRVESLHQQTGLRMADMGLNSRNIAIQLIKTYVRNLAPDLAEGQWQSLQDAGLNQIHFAWAGALEPGQAHYYRLHSPTVLIEYDNTQNNANHIHTIWRDLTQDFGEDLLRAHYEQSVHG